ncbi:cytidylyltransferase domain-containing protein [Magnetospira sp. QH-2]|uniref:acylneuraminate cytidylyltransferase family protein n=1 Tax=Magnetospira sp. (strain QH-2) TaxID=1288970 RepID=UPI0003E81A51|nr:acylneuraminate cytidylyltransferase family protein [Magnetospira sp. QH-2]CCQ75505.1 putative N-acetlyneuraminic acid synthetase [Magnetospira sp. QH-2]
MIDGKSVLALITARGGSKRLPRKNVLDLGGKPLIAWTIEAARSAPSIDRVILSSDDPEIIETAKAWGCEVPFVRPEALSSDTASSEDVVMHALSVLEQTYDYLMLLQPTSPFRTGADMEACLSKCHKGSEPVCVSVVRSEKPLAWMYHHDHANDLLQRLRWAQVGDQVPRHEALEAVLPNGAVYVADRQWFETNQTFFGPQTLGYLMPRERSLDLDTALDFAVAVAMLPQILADGQPS